MKKSTIGIVAGGLSVATIIYGIIHLRKYQIDEDPEYEDDYDDYIRESYCFDDLEEELEIGEPSAQDYEEKRDTCFHRKRVSDILEGIVTPDTCREEELSDQINGFMRGRE